MAIEEVVDDVLAKFDSLEDKKTPDDDDKLVRLPVCWTAVSDDDILLDNEFTVGLWKLDKLSRLEVEEGNSTDVVGFTWEPLVALMGFVLTPLPIESGLWLIWKVELDETVNLVSEERSELVEASVDFTDWPE